MLRVLAGATDVDPIVRRQIIDAAHRLGLRPDLREADTHETVSAPAQPREPSPPPAGGPTPTAPTAPTARTTDPTIPDVDPGPPVGSDDPARDVERTGVETDDFPDPSSASPAKALALRQRPLTAVAVLTPSLERPSTMRLAEACVEEAARRDIAAAMAVGSVEKWVARQALAQISDGPVPLLAVDPVDTDAWLNGLGAANLVVVGRDAATGGVDSVAIDPESSITLALAHLTELGHESIAVVSGPAGVGDLVDSYRRGMRDRGLGGRARVFRTGSSEAAGVAVVGDMLVADLPTALIVESDLVAIGCIVGLHNAGLDVPGDISVIALGDDHRPDLPQISLSTVSRPPRAMATLALDAAARRWQEPFAEPVASRVEPALTARRTTGPAR